MRWETERSFVVKLHQEYSYQKLSKSGNWLSSYSQKCRGCLLRQCRTKHTVN